MDARRNELHLLELELFVLLTLRRKEQTQEQIPIENVDAKIVQRETG